MLSLGSVNWGTSPKVPIAFEYEKQRSGADMKYRVKLTVSPLSGTSYFGYPIYLSLFINGKVVDSDISIKMPSPKTWSSDITYTSGWYTVANKVRGTTSVAFQVYSGYGSNRNETYSYSMAVDPAISSVSASNGTLGTSLNLTVTKYNTTFTHSISFVCGEDNGSVCVKSKETTIAWDTKNGNVLNLARQETGGQSVSVTFTITTYDGTSLVGTDSTTISMAIPNTAKPSVSIKIEDTSGHYSTYGAYVQDKSVLKITATPTLAYDSPIDTYEITAMGSTFDESTATVAVTTGYDTVTAKVTDKRSNSSELVSKTIEVLEYSKPSITVIAYRCNSSGVEDPEGAYMRVGFNATIASLNGKNNATYTIRHGGNPITGTGTSYLSGPISCDVTKVRSIEVEVKDNLDSGTKSAVIPIAFTLMDFYRTGMGVSFGKIATRDGFDCGMTAYFTGDVYIGTQPLAEYIKSIVNG